VIKDGGCLVRSTTLIEEIDMNATVHKLLVPTLAATTLMASAFAITHSGISFRSPVVMNDAAAAESASHNSTPAPAAGNADAAQGATAVSAAPAAPAAAPAATPALATAPAAVATPVAATPAVATSPVVAPAVVSAPVVAPAVVLHTATVTTYVPTCRFVTVAVRNWFTGWVHWRTREVCG
jgi:hypothetical protein